MLDILQEFCGDSMTPELSDSVKEAVKAFDRIGRENYEDGYTDILLSDDTVDTGTTSAEICALTKSIQHQILEEHGIFIHENTLISRLTVYINGIKDIEVYDNRDLILRTCDLETNSEEVFAELLALVTPFTVEDLLPDIDSVSEYFVKRLKQYLIDSSGGDVSGVEQTETLKYITLLKKFIAFTGNDQLRVVELLKMGLPAGYPFTIYAERLNRVLEEMKPEFAAQELFAMALLSEDGYQNPQAIILDNLETYVSSIDHATAITSVVSDYQVRFMGRSQNA